VSEETGGLDQPDGCQEGPFINRPPGWVHSFYGISEDLSLRERCMREICTCSVSGGRRPARKRASSDPTIWLLPVARHPPAMLALRPKVTPELVASRLVIPSIWFIGQDAVRNGQRRQE